VSQRLGECQRLGERQCLGLGDLVHKIKKFHLGLGGFGSQNKKNSSWAQVKPKISKLHIK
jgi:hypothetical protein